MRTRTTIVAALTWLALGVGARADITYTWHEDDTLDVTGSMTVKSAAQAAGQITFSDVTSFAFKSINTYGLSELGSASFPHLISTTDAAPIDPALLLSAQPSGQATPFITVRFDTNWNVSSGESWFETDESPIGPMTFFGNGHWTITGAATTAVPEPSNFVFGALAGLAAIGYSWRRRRIMAIA